MLQHKKFVKKTKQNKIVQVMRSTWHGSSCRHVLKHCVVIDVVNAYL